jgi:hypothetical protein
MFWVVRRLCRRVACQLGERERGINYPYLTLRKCRYLHPDASRKSDNKPSTQIAGCPNANHEFTEKVPIEHHPVCQIVSVLPGFTRAQPPVNNSMRFRQITDSGLLKPARYTILKITLEYGKLRSTMKLLAGRVVCLWKDISNDGLLVVVAIC